MSDKKISSAYEELVAAIVKAVPELREEQCKMTECFCHKEMRLRRPITIEDVLKAMHKSNNPPIGVCTSGEFLDCDNECNNLKGIDINWHLGHSSNGTGTMRQRLFYFFTLFYVLLLTSQARIDPVPTIGTIALHAQDSILPCLASSEASHATLGQPCEGRSDWRSMDQRTLFRIFPILICRTGLTQLYKMEVMEISMTFLR